MPRAYITSRGGAGVSFGCLGTLFFGFFYICGLILYVALVVGIVLVVVLGLGLAYTGAWVAVGIDALLRRYSATYREKRVDRGGRLDWPERVNAKLNGVPARATKNPLQRKIVQGTTPD